MFILGSIFNSISSELHVVHNYLERIGQYFVLFYHAFRTIYSPESYSVNNKCFRLHLVVVGTACTRKFALLASFAPDFPCPAAKCHQMRRCQGWVENCISIRVVSNFLRGKSRCEDFLTINCHTHPSTILLSHLC